MPGMKTTQNSLNVCMAERVWTKHILQRELENCSVFSPLRLLGTIYYLPRILPDRGQGEKYNSSEVTVFYFTLTILCVRFFPEYHFPILHSLLSLKSWFWNSKWLQEDSVHQCWPLSKLPCHTTAWHWATSMCLPLLWVKNVHVESDLAQKGPWKSLTASQTIRNQHGAPKTRTLVWFFRSWIGLLGFHYQSYSHFWWHPSVTLWC